jgi:hypothetical protein
MNANDTTILHRNEATVHHEVLAIEYIEDLFNDEGPFGEADCAGL